MLYFVLLLVEHCLLLMIIVRVECREPLHRLLICYMVQRCNSVGAQIVDTCPTADMMHRRMSSTE